MRRISYLPHLLRHAASMGWHDRILGLSAEAAFWQMLSLPSLLLALVASVGYGIGGAQITNLDKPLARAFSQQVVDTIITPMLQQIGRGRADVISVGFVIAVWAGSSAMATFVNTITIAYGMRDLRGAVRSRLLALWLFLGSMMIGVVVLPLLVLGPTRLPESLPQRLRPTAHRVLQDGYYPAIVIFLMLGLTTLYHLAPPRRLPWRRGMPGAVLAIVIFLLGSAALRTYITFILDHNHAYGALASPIAALLFFYMLAFGVLYGAEFNAAIEQFAPTPVKPPRVLKPRGWQHLQDNQPTDRLPSIDNVEQRPTDPQPTPRQGDAQPDSAQSDRWLS